MPKNNLAQDEYGLPVPGFSAETQANVIERTHVTVVEPRLPGEKRGYLFMKRFVDILLSSCALIGLFPVFLAISIAIKLDSDGPVFFAHERVGKNRKKIRVYKFRTMVKNAQDLLRALPPEKKREFEQNFKLEEDPRITRTGRFLREKSLDELPQLLNVLLGHISFVGPRPVVEKELLKYGSRSRELLSVKPGLTGHWQINGRSDTTYDERVRLDMYYIYNRSLLLDMKTILLTVPAVLHNRGAR